MKNPGNRRRKKRFTELLQEFVCQKNCGLQQALFLMSANKACRYKAVLSAAQQIYDSLKKGNSLSLSLKNCSFISFDFLYISFINYAERCGNLESTLSYLKNKCDREEENLSKIIQALAYPLFVILISIGAALLFSFYSKSIFIEESYGFSISGNLYSSLYPAFYFLLVFCLITFLFLRKILKTDKLYEAFLAAGFLIKGGESLANAVKDAVNILGYESREGQLFAQAGKNLSYGVSLKTAFELDTWNFILRQELEEAFFYAENTGGENTVFEKIALWLKTRNEKRRVICFKLLEPLFICGTGIFLLIFLMNLVLPVFNQSTMIL